MKSLTVGEFKAQFSEVLELIRRGESVGVLYGKSKKPVAKLVPMSGSDTKKGSKRKLGLLKGKMKVVFAPDFKMTEEELIDLGKR
jgi:antitoxin (DNA-binding transcriptional repressor) of toxin-antitoxin stability system